MANMTNKITRRSFGALALGSFSALALAACGSSNTSGSSSSASASATGKKVAPSALPSGMGTTTVDGEFPRTVKHFRGETTIKSAPSKVVILSTGQLDGVLSLGVVPVGAATAGDADLVPTYLKTKFSDKSAELDKYGQGRQAHRPRRWRPSQTSSPSLILINNTNKKDELYESLAKIAPTVVTEGTGVNWKQDFLLIAAALGTTEKAEKLMEEYNTKAKSVGQKAGSEKTFSFLYASADRTRIFAKSSFVGSICADASLARPAAAQVEKTSIDLSSEQLDQADGDYLFYGVQGGDESKLTGEALWSTLKAVTGKHAHSVDADMFFLNAGPAAALGVLETIEKAL